MIPPETYPTAPFYGKLTISRVTLKHANGVYRDPEWFGPDDLPQDWIDFLARFVERTKEVRAYAEKAPYQIKSA